MSQRAPTNGHRMITRDDNNIGQICHDCNAHLMTVKLQDGAYGVVCPFCLLRNARATEYHSGDGIVVLRLHIEPPEVKRVILKLRDVGN